MLPEESRAPMADCLRDLTTQLAGKRLRPGPFSCHGLSVDGRQIRYSWDDSFKAHVGLREDALPVMENVDADTDPAPLVLVFSDEDCANLEIRDFYRRVVLDQARACLLCDLYAHPLGVEYATDAARLLFKTSDGVSQYLGRKRQKNLRRLIRENLFKKIDAQWQDKQPGIRLSQDALQIRWSVVGEKDDFLDWLEDRHTRFETAKPQDDAPLFEQGMGQEEN